MMRQDRFTQQAQEVLAASQEMVRQQRHSQWDVEHVLLALQLPAQALHLLLHRLQLRPHPQDHLHPREVHPQVVDQPLHGPQPRDVRRRVHADVPARPLRLHQPDALVLPQRLRVHAHHPRRDRDHVARLLEFVEHLVIHMHPSLSSRALQPPTSNIQATSPTRPPRATPRTPSAARPSATPASARAPARTDRPGRHGRASASRGRSA